jgi:dihydroneopterin aldolase / 2-amino-4-hydroxy-6-hydroxymethyldihydropteridine diphosphokinase / dihydropteroate synthase
VEESAYESIESLATLLAKSAADISYFETVEVRVRKPSAIPFASAAGVTITRPRSFVKTTGKCSDLKEVYIALGSNMGDRVATIEAALRCLNSSGIEVQCTSSLYESEPMYLQEQPQFLNAVCQARTIFPPRELLKALKKIEVDLGRLPSVRNGPRTMDLDILMYGQEIVSDDDLVIPHKSMLERAFVLQPLAEYSSLFPC